MKSGYNNLWDALREKPKKEKQVLKINLNLKGEKIPIYLNGKMCGFVLNTVYYSHRDPKKHYYVMGGGYPISNSILKKLTTMGVKNVIIIEHAKKGIQFWFAPLEKHKKTVMIEHEPYDQQRCLPLSEQENITGMLDEKTKIELIRL